MDFLFSSVQLHYAINQKIILIDDSNIGPAPIGRFMPLKITT